MFIVRLDRRQKYVVMNPGIYVSANKRYRFSCPKKFIFYDSGNRSFLISVEGRTTLRKPVRAPGISVPRQRSVSDQLSGNRDSAWEDVPGHAWTVEVPLPASSPR